MISTNRYFLRKKTKRENFEENVIDKKPITKIKLIALNDKNYNDNDYTTIKFSSSKRIKLNDLIQNREQLIELDINSKDIFIIDEIELRNNKGNLKESFHLPIYVKKMNKCYISLKHKKKGFCFELIIYSKNAKNLDHYILSHNDETIDRFDRYKLEHRKKINIINIEKSFFNEFIKYIKLDSNSYKICARINNKDEISTSVYELILQERINSKIFSLKANVGDINKIFKLLTEIKNKKKPLSYVKENYKCLDNDEAFKSFIANYEYIKKSYLEIPIINDNDVNILKEYLLKLIINYFFIDKNEIKSQGEKDEINELIIIVTNNIISIINDIENFSLCQEKSTIIKFRLYRSTLYNIYSIISEVKSDKLPCLKILSMYNQKIINLKETSNDNPYYKAIMFLKDIVHNLNEHSCLFDLLLQYNSGISNDMDLLRRKKKKYEDNDTKYELTMLTVKEVANHLEEIIPEFVVRYTCNDDTYSFYSILNDIVFFNEKKTFNNNIIKNLDGFDKYTLAIVILFLHECWGHRKVALSSKINKDSPIRNCLISEDFEENEIVIKNDKTKKVKGESGLEIEYLITGVKYDNIYTKYLLNSHDINNKNLLNIQLWIQPTFDEFRNLMNKNLEKKYSEPIEKLLKKSRKIKDNSNSRYAPKIYYEDDIEIGPLFKV